MKIKDFKLKYQHVLIVCAGVLLISYFLVYIADLRNLFGLRDLYSHLYVPLLWEIIFTERGPIEMFQWLFLGLLLIFSAYMCGILRERGRKKEAMFWIIFSIAGMFMLMEDAGNIRHILLREKFSFPWVMLQSLETLYFVLLAAIPFFAVIKYGKYIKKSKATVILLIFGFLFYGSAAFISGPADLTNINYHIGNTMYRLTVRLGDEELEQIYEETDKILARDATNGHMDVRYRFKDYLIEESLELLGATMLLAAAISYLQFIQKDSKN